MKRKNYKELIFVLILISLVILTIRNVSRMGSAKIKTTEKVEKLKINLQSYPEYHEIIGEKEVIFFINTADFACLTCEQQLLSLEKWIEWNLSPEEKEDVIMLIKKQSKNEEYNNWFVNKWKKENEVKLNIKLVGDSLFNDLNIMKTSVAIKKEGENNLIDYKEFPMVREDFEKIIKTIESKRNKKL